MAAIAAPPGPAAITLPTPPPATFRDIPGLAALLQRLRSGPVGAVPDILHLALPGEDPAAAPPEPGPNDGASASGLAAFPAPTAPSPAPTVEPAASARPAWALPLAGGLALLALLPVRLPQRLRRGSHRSTYHPNRRAAVLVMVAVTAIVVDTPDTGTPAAPAARAPVAVALPVPPGALDAHLRGDLPGSRVVAAAPAALVPTPPIAPVAAQLLSVERAIQADTAALAGFTTALSSGNDAHPAPTTLTEAYTRVSATYTADLDAERAVYDHAAHDPGVAATLAAWAAATSPDNAVRINHNLDAVTASVRATEQRATDASTLAALGAIAPAQQAAIVSGSPFMIPLTGVITQPFGPTTLAIEPTVALAGVVFAHFHTGLDIAAPLDAPVRAAADGVVVFAGPQSDADGHLVGYGNHVVIAHPQGFTTTYGHLDAITVTAGQVIAQGEVVGLEGSTGNSTGPHLHFEIRHDGVPLDPAAYLPGQLP